MASATITHAVVTPSASVAVAAPSGPFEGEILISVTNATPSHKLPATITYDIKGDKLKYSA
ncbi:MAG: hypothetical protein ABI551_16970, partial [Polyangiaceae bacterium]